MVKCIHCKYEWNTKSILKNVVCPSCMKKTPNKKEVQKNGSEEFIREGTGSITDE